MDETNTSEMNVSHLSGDESHKQVAKAETIKEQHPISKDLIEKSRSVETPEELLAKREEFEAIYEKLPDIADKLIESYRATLSVYKLDPGEVRLYMVGGRVKGKPLKETSDIDLIFSVENKSQSPGASLLEGFDPMDSQDYKLIMMRQIMSKLKTICEQQEVANHFHIVDYGANLPQEDVDPTQTLLIGKREKEDPASKKI